MNYKLNKEQGQVIIILLLVVVVALGIGLSAVGRSINEISTSTKTEESTRAFSAAEAGIERALFSQTSNSSFSLGNQSSGSFTTNANLPPAGQALEYPPFGKEGFAQFWLSNHIPSIGKSYDLDNFNLYFGTAKHYSDHNDQPAVEVSVILTDSDIRSYYIKRYYYDSYAGRNLNFSSCATSESGEKVRTNGNTADSSFYCRVQISSYKSQPTDFPVMVRVRILYTNSSHPVALQPAVGASLPTQATIYKATGTAGNSQRTLQVFKENMVTPGLFDYALFSAGDLQKQSSP
ncbi:hypothetical protein HY385_03030 [Candidatus Daviesbacteria bacterium]|nr:hypothetical protein [Candidatus Daviesbacteria bacterium]